VNRQLVDIWSDAFRNKDGSKLELAEDFAHTNPYGVIRVEKHILTWSGPMKRLF
jgi:hypothetical protein